MSDSEEETPYEDDRQSQSMGVDALALKRKQLVQEYRPYVSQEKIVETATAIYFDVMVSVTLKRNKRKAMMAKCAYEAYIQNNIYKDPMLLARKFDIDKKKFMEAQAIFYERLFLSGNLPKYPKVHLTAKQLLPDIVKHFGFESIPIEQASGVIDAMYAGSAFLSRSSPRDVAIVILLWYMRLVNHTNDANKIVTEEMVKAETKIANTKIKEMIPMIVKIVGKR
jgi:transcription initiation factor TFIIIB Brf1 subunit/transcription initiation factor TFIIB